MKRVPACLAQRDAAVVSRLGAAVLEEQSDPGLPDRRTEAGGGGERRRQEERTCSHNFREVSPAATRASNGLKKKKKRTTTVAPFIKKKVVFVFGGVSGAVSTHSPTHHVWILLQNFVPVQRRAAPAGAELRGGRDYPSGPGSARRMVGGREGWRAGMVPLKLRPSLGGKR